MNRFFSSCAVRGHVRGKFPALVFLVPLQGTVAREEIWFNIEFSIKITIDLVQLSPATTSPSSTSFPDTTTAILILPVAVVRAATVSRTSDAVEKPMRHLGRLRIVLQSYDFQTQLHLPTDFSSRLLSYSSFNTRSPPDNSTLFQGFYRSQTENRFEQLTAATGLNSKRPSIFTCLNRLVLSCFEAADGYILVSY